MNMTIETLKRTVAAWIRGWLPFVIVSKNGWLGFLQIQDAVDYLQARSPAGGMIRVGPGTYTEAVKITGDEITLQGAGRATLIDGATVGHAIQVTGADHVTLRDIQVKTTAGQGNAYDGVRLDSASTYCTLDRVFCEEADEYCYYTVSGCKNNRAVNCDFSGSDNNNVYAGAAQNIIIGLFCDGGNPSNIHADGSGDDSLYVANHLKNGVTDAINMEANSENMCCVANRTENGVTDSTGTSTTANNEDAAMT